MIQFLSNQLKAQKGRLPITFRPTGGKWHRGVLVRVDQLGMVVAVGKGQVSVLPWGGVAVINIGGGVPAGAGKQAAAQEDAKPEAKPASGKNGKGAKADK
jgi:hypothetical protein